jgi:hypothetical protein
MAQKPRAALALFTGILAVLVPLVASVYLAWMESYTTEKTLSLTYAQECPAAHGSGFKPVRRSPAESGKRRLPSLFARRHRAFARG